MKKWYDMFRMRFLNPDKYSGLGYIDFEKNKLSPVTNFMLNLFSNTIVDHNIVIAIPSAILYPISLMSFYSAKLRKRSVFVFTQKASNLGESPFDLHHQNYYLLQSEGALLFDTIPVAFLKNDEIHIDFYLPLAKRSRKQAYESKKNVLIQRYMEKRSPKVLFIPETSRSKIKNKFDEIFIENKKEKVKFNFDVGTIIFENMDKIIYSDSKFKNFSEWLKSLPFQDVRYIFHFSNPNSRFIAKFKDEFNTLTLIFNYSFMRNNRFIKSYSIDYFKANKISLLQRLNCDIPTFYTIANKFEIKNPLKSGNIDLFYNNCMSLLGEIDPNKLPFELRYPYYQLINIIHGTYNLLINPGKWRTRFWYYSDWTIREIKSFLSYFKTILSKLKSKDTQMRLYSALESFYSFHCELESCKRCEDQHSYSRISKNYLLYDILKKSSKEKFSIAVSSFEKKILQENLIDLKVDFELKSLNHIQNTIYDVSDRILILPGPILSKYLSIFFIPWKKIIFLCYEGRNKNLVEKQIDLVNKIRIRDEEETLKGIEEFNEVLGLKKDTFFTDFEKRMSELGIIENKESTILGTENQNKSLDIENNGKTKSLEDIASTLFNLDSKFSDLNQIDNDDSNLSKQKNEINEKIYQESILNEDHYEVELLNEDTGNIMLKKLLMSTTYMYLENLDSDVKYGFPRVLKPDYYLLLIGQDEKKSMIDLISQFSGMEDEIDYELIKTWQTKISMFYEKNYTKVKDFYEVYQNHCDNKGKKSRTYATFRKWISGETTYTQDEEDLYFLGEIMGDSFFLENYEDIQEEGRKLQNLHQKISKSLKIVISKILNKEVDLSSLSFEEFELFQNIENNIFKIQSINKITKER